jgi:peptide/nickel transport system substrate-binding protein
MAFCRACRVVRTRTLWCVAVALACTACSQQPTRPSSEPTALHLQIGTALPRRGVPGVGVRELVLGLFGETILAPDRNGKTLPRLCERWEWLNDGTVLKLTLKRGIRFHDDTELSADLAAGLLRREFGTNRALSYKSVTRVDVTDPQTVLIHLNRREAFLPEDLTDVRLTKGTIGTGPFVLEGSMPAAGQTTPTALHAFEKYHQGVPQVKRIDVKAYQTLRSAWAAMMRGEINMLYEVSREAAAFVKDESSVQSYPFLRPYTLLLAFNMRHPILGRRDVRQALGHAVDRPGILRDGMAGQGEPADGPIWKYHWAYSTAQRTYDFNPEAARLRLDAAGFAQRRDGAGTGMPSRFSFKCLMFGEDPRFERVALVLQKQLYDVGVDMQIEAVPLEQMSARMAAGQFDAFFFEMISSRSLMWLYRIWRSKQAGAFDSGYQAADAALDRLRETLSEQDTRAAVSELQRVLFEDPPALFLAWPATNRAVNAAIDVPYEPNIDIFGRVWRFQRSAGLARR